MWMVARVAPDRSFPPRVCPLGQKRTVAGRVAGRARQTGSSRLLFQPWGQCRRLTIVLAARAPWSVLGLQQPHVYFLLSTRA